MEVEKAILGRRSVRSYLDKPVPEDIIKKLLKAGAMAPSAMDRQPCRFIVISDTKLIKSLSDKVKEKAGTLGVAARFAERMKLKEDVIFHGAPLLVLVVAEEDKWGDIDSALAAQNMMLRAYDLGLGSCFIGFATMLADELALMRSLGLKDGQRLVCPLIFGFPKGWPEPKSREARVQK
ncbi:MAG: nitroreductase family protein [Candidatus Micrarchaeota archaeon]